jgi:hypothetical protein
LKTFQSINGHDRTTMTALVVYLQDRGIAADFYFSQIYPVGFASMTGGMGEYLLFVEPDKTDDAEQALRHYFQGN